MPSILKFSAIFFYPKLLMYRHVNFVSNHGLSSVIETMPFLSISRFKTFPWGWHSSSLAFKAFKSRHLNPLLCYRYSFYWSHYSSLVYLPENVAGLTKLLLLLLLFGFFCLKKNASCIMLKIMQCHEFEDFM